MSPTKFQSKRDITDITHNHDHHQNTPCNNNPPQLKINKGSQFIKKSTSSSSSSSSSTLSLINNMASAGSATKQLQAAPQQQQQQQQRHPVIIYTHSPKIIHTHPRDFMALVQKLTGLSRSDTDADASPQLPKKPETPDNQEAKSNISKGTTIGSDINDNESSSVITDENCSSNSTNNNNGDHGLNGQVNSCFIKPPCNPFITNIPVFAPNNDHFLCPNSQPFYNYTTDSLFFPIPNMPNSVSSTSTLQSLSHFHEY